MKKILNETTEPSANDRNTMKIRVESNGAFKLKIGTKNFPSKPEAINSM